MNATVPSPNSYGRKCVARAGQRQSGLKGINGPALREVDQGQQLCVLGRFEEFLAGSQVVEPALQGRLELVGGELV